MPRIRTLKPDHRLHRKVGTLSDATYRLWVGMILEADDDGRLVAEPEQLKALIFGLRPQMRRGEIERGLNELQALRLIHIYSHDGTRYAWFPSWKDHQRINRPSPSRLPPSPEELERMVKGDTEHSVSPHGVFTEDSQRKGSGRERKGSGREGSGEGAPPNDFQSALDRLKAKHQEIVP